MRKDERKNWVLLFVNCQSSPKYFRRRFHFNKTFWFKTNVVFIGPNGYNYRSLELVSNFVSLFGHFVDLRIYNNRHFGRVGKSTERWINSSDDIQKRSQLWVTQGFRDTFKSNIDLFFVYSIWEKKSHKEIYPKESIL